MKKERKATFCSKLSVQIEQVSSESDDSDDDPLALALRSLRYLSASQILFAS